MKQKGSSHRIVVGDMQTKRNRNVIKSILALEDNKMFKSTRKSFSKRQT